LLKIIIIILLVAVVPVGFLFLLGGLAATLAVPVGLFLVVGLGVYFLRDRFTAATRKNKTAQMNAQLPPILEEMGFDSAMVMAFMEAYIAKLNRTQVAEFKFDYDEALAHPSIYRMESTLKDVARSNPQFIFALDDDYYLKMFDAAMGAAQKIKAAEVEQVNEQARQSLPDDIKIAVDYFRACQARMLLDFKNKAYVPYMTEYSKVTDQDIAAVKNWVKVQLSVGNDKKKALEIAQKKAFRERITEDNHELMLATAAKAVCAVNKQSGRSLYKWI